MRPGNQSNKRMRGRGRKGPNPLTRTYESNGPDVKIRGTAMHIAEKYQQLARDAQASGDRVMSENYNQHAEHYLRIVAAAQPQQQPAMQSNARQDGDEGSDMAPAHTNGHANGGERAQQEAAASDSDLMDADSPQPFIEDMPVIDQEGKVNGAGQKAEAGEEQAEDKPRRRTRTPRTRAPRRAASDTANDDGAADAAPEDVEAANGGDGEEAAKPRRRTTRPRRTKAADEAPAEAVPASD
ncbi:DUF4167 domain-containing protein [Roseibium sediminicola]|uniref:DUF4167 domain-containing protein n=1 Tax=Roseibium sediminicola TaxID=2933272 RepID=A0ABT0GTC1_9HYPH|nr:DUF4167 domain-containing protein [Roseibium sp. CAU 1639]MCK7612536.1 DUF4167 domain-containing protein [Roseibium sp. CAU 1639]